MNRRLALTIALGALFVARRATAQDVSIGYQGLPYKATGESSTGINIAEGMLLHVGVGAEAGYDSNVFYSNSSDPQGVISSGILRFTGFGEISNAIRGSAAAPTVSYDVRAGLTYRRYTSDNPNVQLYRDAFMPTAGLALSTGSGPWGFKLTDSFIRVEDPPYLGLTAVNAMGALVQTTPTPLTRDDNVASAEVQWSPGGGRITGTLRYSNIIDVFEASSGFDYASSLTHQLLLDVSWKWLPKTALFAEASQGYVTYLTAGQTLKVSSYPLRAFVGLRGLITPKTSAIVSLGYANAFYSSGATTSGILGSSYVDLQLAITPTMLSRVTLGYHQDFADSAISNFVYQYSFYASYLQQIAGRLALDLSGRLSYLRYQELLFDRTGERSDLTATVGASLDYFVRNWAYCGLGYSLTDDFSSYHLPTAAGAGTGPSVGYVKNQVFARLGVTY
jgi:hypothetical protein